MGDSPTIRTTAGSVHSPEHQLSDLPEDRLESVLKTPRMAIISKTVGEDQGDQRERFTGFADNPAKP